MSHPGEAGAWVGRPHMNYMFWGEEKKKKSSEENQETIPEEGMDVE